MNRQKKKDLIIKTLKLQAEPSCPEEDLAFAVIERAIKDVDRKGTTSSKRDFRVGNMNIWLQAVGISPAYVRLLFRQAKLL